MNVEINYATTKNEWTEKYRNCESEFLAGNFKLPHVTNHILAWQANKESIPMEILRDSFIRFIQKYYHSPHDMVLRALSIDADLAHRLDEPIEEALILQALLGHPSLRAAAEAERADRKAQRTGEIDPSNLLFVLSNRAVNILIPPILKEQAVIRQTAPAIESVLESTEDKPSETAPNYGTLEPETPQTLPRFQRYFTFIKNIWGLLKEKISRKAPVDEPIAPTVENPKTSVEAPTSAVPPEELAHSSLDQSPPTAAEPATTALLPLEEDLRA